MTYFAFLFYFVLIPILILLAIAISDHRAGKMISGFNNKLVPFGIAVHVFLAVTYTTPWDNYLVATGVWSYNPNLVTGIVIGYVPIEEYTFFIVETILAGLWWWFLARRIALTPSPSPNGRGEFPLNKALIIFSSSLLLVVFWLFFTYQFFFGADEWNYLGIIFFWALPAILPQLIFGADILWHHRKLVFWSIFVPGLYLALMDIVALSETTWQISRTQTLGIDFFGILPLEEVTFFFITNVLISFGMTLMLSDLGRARFEVWKSK
jgi:lycopene cyclase domain-containing protein